MIQITTEDGKYFFSEFVNLIEEQTKEIDENTLTLVDLQYILLAYKTKRITLSEGDLLKVNNKIKELSSTGGGGVMPDLSDYVTKQELIEEVFKLRGDLGEEITMESISQSLTEIDRLYSEIETKIEEVPENLSTTVTELQTFKSTVETDYTKKTDLDSYATKDELTEYAKTSDIILSLNEIGESLDDQLSRKVDKIEGKGLSTEDFTTAYKTKLDTVLPISSGGTGATTLADLKAALGVPQFIQITQEDYDSLGDIEKNDPLKLYLIIG